MRDLGAKVEVRHRYETTRNKPRQLVIYRCDRCGEEFSRTRKFSHGRIYRHVRCHGTLQFIGTQPITMPQDGS
jgi:predicted SprT family Zn-dependent metalloprotease